MPFDTQASRNLGSPGTATSVHSTLLSPQQQHQIQLYTTPAICPAFPPANDGHTDLVFVSSDNMAFYVNSAIILARSQNRWDSQVPYNPQPSLQGHAPYPPIRLTEGSDVLSVVLHTLHGRSCAHLEPSNHSLIASIHSLVKYGLHLRTYIAEGTPLFALLLDRARAAPLQFYTLAAQYDLEALATPISALLLTYDPSDITDEYAVQMGPRYLRRLLMLPVMRMDMLKRLVLPPPPPHPPTDACGRDAQDAAAREWAYTAAMLVIGTGPAITEITLDVQFRALGRNMVCPLCIAALDARVHELVQAWSRVKRTI